MQTNQLLNYGVTTELLKLATENPNLELARVIGQNRIRYNLSVSTGSITATVAGRFEKMVIGVEDYPAVGDWVFVQPPQTSGDTGTIQRLIPRTSSFTRKSAGNTSTLQVVAANIDVLFLCMAVDANFNVRRLERYLAIAYDSGAQPVIILTKTDLSADLATQISTVQSIAVGVTILKSNAADNVGCQEVADYVVARKTYAFLGSSGVGKSTLINQLMGQKIQATTAIRVSDAHGRHTTTGREMLVLPSGGIVIDTPGMRELSIVDANLADAFADITEIAMHCRFRDCTHKHEPGCAVQAAIEAGNLEADRLVNYQQLIEEQQYNSNRHGKSREKAKIERMFGSKKNMKAAIKASRNRHR